VLFAVSNAPVLAKGHLAPIMTPENFAAQEAWSALHQLFELVDSLPLKLNNLAHKNPNQSRELGRFTDELGLAAGCDI
jgi:hypothetical protein